MPPVSIGLGVGVDASLSILESVNWTGRKVGIVFVTGNSHSIGRIPSVAGDAFPSNVYEFKQEGNIRKTGVPILDVGDTSGNYSTAHYSPFVTFASDLAAARSDLSFILFVANGQGSTGFVDGTWSVANIAAPNRLAGAVSRYNTAYDYLIAHGANVEVIAGFHLSSKPDADVTVNDAATVVAKANAYATAQDSYIDYIRANLHGFTATTPVVVSMAMTLTQITADGVDNHIFAAAGNGSPFRKAYTWFMDPINDWGYGVTGLPVVPFDGTHANHDGEVIKGHLLYQGYLKAITNSVPDAPFSGLSTWSSAESLYDFRAGDGNDKKGTYHLAGAGALSPLVRYDSRFGTRVYDRPNGSGRMWKRNRYLPANYTWFARVSFDTIAAVQGLFMNTDTVAGSEAQYRAYLNASGQFVLGHGPTAQITADLGVTANTICSIAVSYDGTTLSLYRNGTLVTTAAAPAVDNQRGLFIGAQNSAAAGPLLGDMQALAVFNRALTAPEILALHNATYTR